MTAKLNIMAFLFIFSGLLLFSQTPYMVKDINLGTASSNPSKLTAVNNTLFFTVFDASTGLELWKSDGTTAGTVLVKDINPGIGSSNVDRLTNANGTLFFRANDGINGPELWKSDGTAAGTVMVKNINPSTIDNNSNQLAEIISIVNEVYFMADDGINGYELWKSNGTEAGTFMVKDINQGAESSYPFNMANIDGMLFFGAFDAANGYELWKSNGTEAGTLLVKNINPGASNGLPSNSYFTNVDGIVLFRANDGVNGLELWKSDGTESGTAMVKDIYPGNNGSTAYSSIPLNLKEVNGALFFTAQDGIHGYELWKSDGTEAGTVMVKDLKVGINSSNPTALSNCNGTLYFQANDGPNGIEVWKSDGTESGTKMLKDPASSVVYAEPNEFTFLNGFVYFAATSYTIGLELFRTDGTPEGTIGYNIRYLTESSSPANLTTVGNTLYFTANNGPNGRELWALATEALSIEDPIAVNYPISIYPNPAKNLLTIRNPSNHTISGITIMDMMGKIIIKQNNPSNQIDIEYLKQGMYFLQTTIEGKSSITKFIKR
ncbi:ELWxxDGT repeat protein [Mariniflexile maritimum]|uniref:ELWxxDGT repeat protein n=1 Tax=Mariniflexile maritimum TaxID=2682493 RepID=UPI0012F6FC99|nr:ELWxxDGT repeat protein [Mariniflexile maritimum]